MKSKTAGFVCLIVLACMSHAQLSPSPQEAISYDRATAAPRVVTVGTAVPNGGKFIITLNDKNIDWAYPEWARPLPNARTAPVTKEQFRAAIRDGANRKLTAMFPGGLPPDAASKIKISIHVKFSKPPEFTISVEF